MDFEDDENDHFFPNIAHIRENKLSQDVQHRSPRKSPRKRHRTATRSSTASLVIDQLKNGFRRDVLALPPRMRVRRNWRLEFLMKHFRNNRCGRDDEERTVTMQERRSRNLVPEAPRIYSIGLHSSASALNDRGDLSGDATRNALKKRLNVIRRAMIVCKYWIAQSSPPPSSFSANAALKKHTDQQAMIIDRANSTDASPKFAETLKSDECSEKNNDGYFLCDDCSLNMTFETVSDDRPFKSDDFSAQEDHEGDGSRVIRKDAQIQTSDRTGGRQKKTRGKSKTVSERMLGRKYDKDKSMLKPPRESFADLRSVDWYHSDERNRIERSKLSARVLQNRCAEYMNKFQAVSRQIEEITATLKETCYGDRNLRGNPEDCEKYSSFMPDYAKAKRKLDKSEFERILPKESTPKEKKHSGDIERIAAESDYERSCNNLQEISRIDYVNDETPVMRRSTAALSINHYKNSDNFSYDCATFTKPIHPASKTSGSSKTRDRVVKQISFQLNLTKGRNEAREFPIEDEPFSEIYMRNDLGNPNRDEYANLSTASFVDLERSRSKKLVEEKMGERAILVDIKRRIDRDFDDGSMVDKCENDVEDFLAVSRRRSGNFAHFDRYFCDQTTPKRITMTEEETIEESRFPTPVLTREPSSDTADIRIRDSTSAGAVSEHSNERNSTLSKYFSCTQFSSLISLTENEDDQDRIARRQASPSVANLHSESNRYDFELLSSVDYLNSDSSPYNYAHSDGDFNANFNGTNFNSECTTPLDTSARDKHAENFLIEPNDIFETFNGKDLDSSSKLLCDHKYFLGDDAEEKQPRGRFEKRRTVDSTFDSASKSSRYIGSIDSGVFVNSSLIDFHRYEGSAGKSPAVEKEIRSARRSDESSPDSSSDGSYTDDTLARRVDNVVRDLTKNLILCERRARTRLEEMKASYRNRSRTFKFSGELHDAYHDLFDSARRSSEDEEERIVSISTPSLLSLSDSESDERM